MIYCEAVFPGIELLSNVSKKHKKAQYLRKSSRLKTAFVSIIKTENAFNQIIKTKKSLSLISSKL